MLEKYLKLSTYNYVIHAKFVKDNMEHVVAQEFDPSGYESNFFILFHNGKHIVNQNGDLCANIKGDTIEVVEC